MSIDGLSLHTTVFELQKLVGGKIDKIQQPDKDSVLFAVRSNGLNYKLYISIHSDNGRAQLTNISYENPMEPPMFCMLLRKHLLGSRIDSITQYELDRVFSIQCTGRNDLGDTMRQQLFVELMDRHSNITLVQNEVILDCLKRVSPDMSPVRVLLPGLHFELPPKQEKKDLLLISEKDCENIFSHENAISFFQNSYSGLSKNLSSVLLNSFPSPNLLFNEIQALKENCFIPCILLNQEKMPLCVLPFQPNGYDFQKFSCISEAYDNFYKTKDIYVRIQRNSSSLKKSIGIKLKRSRNKLALYQNSIHSDASTEQCMLFGNLINANLYQLKKGQKQYTVTNYYSDPPALVSIPADPLLAPVDNAQKYFKKYKKAKTAKEFALLSIQHELEEISYLESQLDNIEKCTKLSELDEIREELIQQKYLKPDRKMQASKKNCSRPFCYLSSDNFRIYVGKNNKQNDYLTFKFSKSSDIWMHVKDYTGSHVIIECDGTVPERTLFEAATVSAYYSHGNAAPTVTVDYTLKKYVKKNPGSKPGNVIYTNQKSIYVSPDSSILSNLMEISEEKK